MRKSLSRLLVRGRYFDAKQAAIGDNWNPRGNPNCAVRGGALGELAARG